MRAVWKCTGNPKATLINLKCGCTMETTVQPLAQPQYSIPVTELLP